VPLLVCCFFRLLPVQDNLTKTMKTMIHSALLIVLLASAAVVEGGPLAYATCQTACNYGAVSCYSAAGLIFGVSTAASAATGPVGWVAWLTTTPTSTLAAAAACSAAQGVCMAACTPLLVAPTP
jgi:hypothetical protein